MNRAHAADDPPKACSGTSLAEIAACLKQAAKTGSGSVAVDASGVEALTAILGRSDIPLRGVDPDSIPKNPTAPFSFKATTPATPDDVFLYLSGYSACATFFMDGTNVAFLITVTLPVPGSWSFGTSWPEIANQAADDLTWSEARLFLSSAGTTPLGPPTTPQSPAPCGDTALPVALDIPEGLSFWGTTRLDQGVLTPLTKLLLPNTNIPTVGVAGAITKNADPPGPTFDIRLQDDTLPLGIPGSDILKVAQPLIGLKLEYVTLEGGSGKQTSAHALTRGEFSDDELDIATDDPPALYPVTVPYLGLQLTIGSLPPIVVEAFLMGGDSFEIVAGAATATTDFDSLSATVGDNAAAVKGLATNDKGLTSLLDTIQFKGLRASVSTDPVALTSVSLAIGSAPGKAWQPIGGDPPPLNVTFDFYATVASPTSNAVIFGELDAKLKYQRSENDTPYEFDVSVTLPDLIISGSYSGEIDFNLSSLVASMGVDLAIPNNLAEFDISSMGFSADIQNSRYAIHAVVDASVNLFGTELLGLENTTIGISMDASDKSKPTQVTGTVVGTLVLVDIELALDATISNSSNVDTVFKLHLVNETIGSMLTRLIKLVDPSFTLELGSPWSKLLDISLDAFVVDVNVTKGEVGLEYDAKLDLGFLDIDTISLTYRKDPVQSGVVVAIQGSFLGQPFGKPNPLAWDAVNGTPPAVPGETAVLDVRYVAMGQHVTIEGIAQETSMEKVVCAMEKALLPPKDGSGIPPLGQGGVEFSAGSAWLFGADFTVMGTVRLAVVFNDPEVYGLLVVLSGSKAKSLAGLSFEILYRKISDSIGLYHIDFALPTQVRHFELGEVSITLPTLVLDIYTNGNFRVDLGFPANMDFSNSFCIEVFPFVGYGGFYFAVLSGATSSRVPQITNGNFNPVIEFGLGLSVGVGKTIDEGVFKAGLTVAVSGIVEGVIGWFNPTLATVPSDRYYWIHGTAEIVGNLYGSVDFGIIKADVSVEVYASVTLVIEAYEPILINLVAGVSVSVSVKIVFFTIHFSFSMTVRASFTIGSRGTPPWQVQDSGAPSLTSTQRATLHTTRSRFAALASIQRIEALRSGADEQALQWVPVPTVNPDPPTIDVVVAPAFSVVDGATRCIVLTFVENAIQPSAVTAREIRQVSDPDVSDKAFNQLVAGFLQWAVVAWQSSALNPPNPPDVTIGALHYILEQLDKPGTEDAVFTYENLQEFIGLNFKVQLTTRPTETDPSQRAAAIYPMTPALAMEWAGGSVDFGAASPVDSAYTDKLGAYFEALDARYEKGAVAGENEEGAVAQETGASESLATAIFRNYHFMLAKASVRAALEVMKAYPFDPTTLGKPTLVDIAKHFRAVGGEAVTPEDVVTANQSKTGILTQQSLPIAGVKYQAASGATPSSVASAFPPLTPVTLLTTPVAAMEPAADEIAGLLQPGATLTINSTASAPVTPMTFTVEQGDTLPLIASWLVIRNAPGSAATVSGAGAFVQSVINANPTLPVTDPYAPLAVGTLLNMPSGAATPEYTVREGDNLTLVAAYLLNITQQAVSSSALLDALQASTKGDLPAAGQPITVPQIQHVMQAGETIRSIADAFLLSDTAALFDASDLATVPLAPLAVVPIPRFDHPVGADDSLATIAQTYGLTLAELASCVQDAEGIFSAKIVVPDVPSIPVGELVSTLVSEGHFNDVSGMVSRFLLHGMQIPDPADEQWQSLTIEELETEPWAAANITTAPLYELVGQQIAPPADGAIVLFASTYAVQQGDSVQSIWQALISATGTEADFEQWLRVTNPAVSKWESLSPGTVLVLPATGPLPASYTVQDGDSFDLIAKSLAPLQASALTAELVHANNSVLPAVGQPLVLPPAFPQITLQLTLAPEETSLESGLANATVDGHALVARLPLYAVKARKFTLQKHLAWQAPTRPPFLGPASQAAAGQSVWLFSQTLTSQLTQALGTNVRYELCLGTHHDQDEAMSVQPASSYAWATLVEFDVRRVAAAQEEAAIDGHTYLVLGAGDAGQQLLEGLLPTVGSDTTVHLLYRPSPAGDNPSGYVSGDLSADASTPPYTFLLKANLSRESHGPAAATDDVDSDPAPEAPPTGASIASAPEFLTFLWECGVVRSGGYYLNYADAKGNGLPDTLFGRGDTATLAVLVVVDGQDVATPATSPLPAAVNCVVVGDNVDPTSTNVFVRPVVMTIADGDSLTTVAGAYNAARNAGIGSTACAVVNQDVPGLLQPGREIALPQDGTYQVQYGDTLASIATSAAITVDDLAAANPGSAMLQAGAQVQLFDPPALTVVTGDLDSVVLAFHDQLGISADPGQIAFDNRYAPNLLAVGETLNLPSGPYTIVAGDTFGGIAATHGVDVHVIAALNHGAPALSVGATARCIPALLEQTASVSPGNSGVQMTRANPQALAYTIQDSDSLDAISTKYNLLYGIPALAPADVAAANQYLPGLLRPGASLIVKQGSSVEIEPGDTFASIAKAAGVAVADVANSSPDVQAYQIGVTIALDPSKYPDTDAQRYAQEIFQLLEFNLAANAAFNASGPGLPAGPIDDTKDDATIPPLWRYRRALAVNGFARVPPDIPPPSSTVAYALPTKKDSPYAGIGPGSTASLALGLRDVFGNQAKTTPPITTPIDVPVGYFDELLPVSRWPGAALAYELDPGTEGRASLVIGISFQPDRYLPAAGQDPRAPIRSAAAASVRYRTAYQQLQRADASARWRASVDAPSLTDEDTSAGNPYSLDLGPLQQFAAHALLFAGGVAALEPVVVETKSQTLGGVATAYSLTAAQVLDANHGLVAEVTFTEPLTVPVLYASKSGESLQSIAAALANRVELDVADVATHNQTVALQGGVALTTPTVRTYATTGQETLDHVTQIMNCSVAGLVTNNAGTGVLSSTFEFAIVTDPKTGASVNCTSADGSFRAVVDCFDTQRHMTVDAVQLARLNSTKAGMFAPNLTLTIPDAVTQANDTIAAFCLDYPCKVTDLATSNPTTAGLFPVGTVLSGGDVTNTDAEATIAEVASANELTYDQLGSANATAAFVDGVKVVIPAAVTYPVGQPFPYRAKGTEKLADIAQRAGVEPLDLLALSQDVRGLFTPATEIAAGSASVQTTADSTFFDIVGELQAKDSTITAEEVATAIASVSGLIPADCLVVLPPIRVGQSTTLADLASDLNSDPSSLALVHAAVQGFLKVGQGFTYTPPAQGTPWTHSIASGDTLFTLVQQAGAYYAPKKETGPTFDELVSGIAGQDVLDPASFVVPLPPGASTYEPVISPAWEGTIFPITVTLELGRPAGRGPGQDDLVDPDFRESSPVFSAPTLVPPSIGAAIGASGTLVPFATAFEAAFPGLRVATGQPASPDARPSLWAVDLSTGTTPVPIGVEVTPGSQSFYAVKPLSTSLWSGSAPVPTYDSTSGLGPDNDAETKQFQSIDLDGWARSLLDAVDLFLTPAYAVPAYELDPVDVDQIAAQKQRLAATLGNGVTEILQGDADEARRTAAADVLVESLLVQLGAAYEVDALVQYEVAVASSPYSDATMAPRFSGKVRTDVYTTGTLDTLQSIATKLEVSAEYVALSLQAAQHILAAGQVITVGNKQPHPLTSYDTLASVAIALGVDVTELAEATLQNAQLGLFAANDSLGIYGLSRPTGANETFASLAKYFDDAPGNVGLANKDTPLIPAGDYSIDGKDLAVPQLQSLSEVVPEVAKVLAPAEVTVEDVAERLLVKTTLEPAVLQPQVSVYGLQSASGYNLSTAKVPLAKGTTTLTTLLTVKAPARRRSLTLDLDFVVNQLELPTAPPDGQGYQPSDWLSFVTAWPVESFGELGQVEIPVPLRAYPDPASLISQSGDFLNPPVHEVDLRQWGYEIEYEHRSAAQDSVFVELDLNQVPLDMAFANGGLDLPQALARFTSIYPLLKDGLSALATTTPGRPNPPAQAAIKALATLVTQVADAWEAAWPPPHSAWPDADVSPPPDYEYEIEVVAAFDGTLSEVTLTDVSEHDPNDGSIIWPAVSLMDATGWHTLDPSGEGGDTETYAFDLDTQASAVTNWRLRYGLDLIDAQNAWAGVTVKRNQDLVSSGAQTNEVFVYATPQVGFKNALTPLLTTDTTIRFGNGDLDGLRSALEHLFEKLLSSGTLPIPHVTIACSYAFQVNPGGDGAPGPGLPGLVALVPVFLGPHLDTTYPTTADGLADLAYEAVATWSNDHPHSAAGGSAYYFDVSVYGTINQSSPQPLLRAKSLCYLLDP